MEIHVRDIRRCAGKVEASPWHSGHPVQDHTNNHTNKEVFLYKPTPPDGLTDHHAVSSQLQSKLSPENVRRMHSPSGGIRGVLAQDHTNKGRLSPLAMKIVICGKNGSSWSSAIDTLPYAASQYTSMKFALPSMIWMRVMTPGRTCMVAAPAGPSRISAEAATVLYVRVRVDGFFDEGAVWSPAMITCLAMVEQLGLFVACQQRGHCRCYLNGSPLHAEPVAANHGDFLAIYKSDHARSDVLGHAMLSTASTRRLGGSTGTVSECPSGQSAAAASDVCSEAELLPE